ncbi:MAG: translation initiation factor IF-2 [Nitrospirae bacterium]|nr:translation initiation factor IF-2 [Nitrospirota bacterium]
MRVYELARDLGLTSRELLAALEKMGVTVEDHASRLSDEDIAKARQKLDKGAAAKKKAPARGGAAPAPEPEQEAETDLGKARMVVVKRRRVAVQEPARPVAVEAPAPSAPQEATATETAAPKGVRHVSAEAAASTPAGLTPHVSAEELTAQRTRERVVIDLEAHKPKARKAVPEAIKPVEAPKRPATSLPSAADRVRTLEKGRLTAPKGLTPHMDEAPAAQRERVVIDLPQATPARPPAKVEKKERKKGRPEPAPQPPADTQDRSGGPAGHKRKWQSFKGKKGKGKGREDLDHFAMQRRKEVPVEGSRPRVKAIKIQEGATVKEFADALGVKAAIIIAEMMKLGTMVTLNDPIDLDAAQLIAGAMEVNMEVVLEKTEEQLLEVVEDTPESLKSRAPVVTIMGHVDHGKTSLLDKIRTSRVAAREAGGITQHIGAYAVETPRGRIVFLDTPGHEAFTAMRARGAQVTDIVVLVVAADDGVMPQTVEAINHAKGAHVPIIVAITKMDKPDANPDKVRQTLTEYELVSEAWGGDTQFAEVSAHTGAGIDALLERILLQSEIMELKANPDKLAVGMVVEARLDRGRGPVATVLIQSGTLRVGDFFVTGTHTGRVRAMADDLGTRLDSAGPATPVEIIGLEGVPNAGDTLISVTNEKAAKAVASDRRIKERTRALAREKKLSLVDLFAKMQEQETIELPLVLRADVQGSVEAIQDGLEKLSTDKVKVRVLHTGVGGITETDVMLAAASNAIVIGFSVRPEPKAAKLAEVEGVDIRLYNIIYNLIDDVKAAMEGLLEPLYKERSLGRAEVRDVFQVPKVGAVAGCYVLEGTILRHCAGLRVVRDNVVVHEGPLNALRRFKEDVKEVKSGFECGISFERFNDIKVGDIIEAFALDEIAATL